MTRLRSLPRAPTTIIACVALFFSLGGVGVAASGYRITSTRQTAPSARHALRGHRGPRGPAGPQGTPAFTCPSGVPTQTITVINQANVRGSALAKVERAVEAQSLQLRAWWQTPCVQFGPGGWKLYLKVGTPFYPSGEHDWNGQPYMLVWTGGGTWESWSVPFSHEIVETLVDPENSGVYHNEEGVSLEVADPVADQAYRIGRVFVADFVLPSWFAGGMQTAWCGGGAACRYTDPLAGSGGGWPFDFMHTLGAAWQSDSAS